MALEDQDTSRRGIDKNLVLSLPFLHWDTDDARKSLRDTIEDVAVAQKSKPPLDLGEALTQNSQMLQGSDGVQVGSRIDRQWDSDTATESALVSHRRNKLGNADSGDASSGNESPRSISDSRPLRGPIERSRHQKSAQKIKELAKMNCPTDEKLIKAYLFDNRSLHVRRTLDQFYYYTLKSTDRRDGDQVLSRYTEKSMNKKLVFMVHQLWLWVLDEGNLRRPRETGIELKDARYRGYLLPSQVGSNI